MPSSAARQIDERLERAGAWWRNLNLPMRGTAVFVVALLLLFARRPLQFLSPDVWLEDGLILIPDFYDHGGRSLLRPVYDYLALAPRVVTYVALQWPLEYYATIGTVLAVAFDIFVVLCVAFAPTILRHRVMCAICMLLVPIYSEVYSLPLYVFWFASFLPVLALIWLPDRTGVADRWVQLAFVVVGGLSSPFIIALFPLFLVRAFVVRRRSELLLLIAAATTVGAQIWNAFPANARIRADSVADLVELTLSKFFGYYLLSPAGRLPALALGCILFAYVGYSFLRQLRVVDSADERLRCLLYILPALAIAASVARAPLAEIDPNDWGPRYFFLPFTFLSWILWNAPVDSPRMKRIGPMIVALSVLNSASHFIRLQTAVDWAGAARERQVVGTSRLPLQMSGEVEDVLFIYTDEGGKWKVEIPPAARRE